MTALSPQQHTSEAVTHLQQAVSQYRVLSDKHFFDARYGRWKDICITVSMLENAINTILIYSPDTVLTENTAGAVCGTHERSDD
jgi:hypothetical protein